MEGTLKLISNTSTQNSIGVSIKTETKRNIFCKVESASQNEFFSAGQQNLKAEYKFTILVVEYENEKLLEYEGVKYSIYRTYKKSKDKIELYCTKKVGV